MKISSWFLKAVRENTSQLQSKFPNKYNLLVIKIDQIRNDSDFDQAVIQIKDTFSGTYLKEQIDYAYLMLVIEKLKLKHYSISDDVIKITFTIKQIYEHIIYEKSKLQ